ncbi:LuxR family two component transcriptional regulator [Microbacterium sp. AG157]|uniref:response regulator transcription factor n=1 Tax=Microbacterium sp. AG157 TaxID=2183993 RepID=UPI000E282325|nr:response regulator transcription factor [Microbacterium sp. AG157]REC98193.1 LuxR family two component transcriptional regulator [Microbacterium sp. AG157]
MRVAIADDGTLFREGLVMLLAAAGHDVVAAHDGGDELLVTLDAEQVDIAILDIRMPPGEEGGLVTARRIRAQFPDIGLLMLSHYAESHFLRAMLEIGTEAIGYRLKERIAGVQMLNDTLQRIHAREIVIEPVLASRLIEIGEHRDGAMAGLGERELDVLRLMAEGRANRSIAEQLFVSVKAVEKHVASLFVKLEIPGDATMHHRRVLAVLSYLQAQKVGGAGR